MDRNPSRAAAYFRTSSAANVGDHKDSLRRQQEAVRQYARSHGLKIVEEFYDAAVSGADPINERPAFADLLARVRDNGVGVVLVEDPTRFARDLVVQLTGHALLKGLGVELVPANCPSYFADDTPTAVMVRQILGAVSQFEKAQLVRKLRAARERKRAETGRCEGRRPVPACAVVEARRLYRRSPKTGQRRSLRTIAAELARLGHVNERGVVYGAESIRRMVAR